MTPHERGAVGQDAVEYGLILIGIVLVAVVTLVVFSDAVAAGLDLLVDLIEGRPR